MYKDLDFDDYIRVHLKDTQFTLEEYTNIINGYINMVIQSEKRYSSLQDFIKVNAHVYKNSKGPTLIKYSKLIEKYITLRLNESVEDKNITSLLDYIKTSDIFKNNKNNINLKIYTELVQEYINMRIHKKSIDISLEEFLKTTNIPKEDIAKTLDLVTKGAQTTAAGTTAAASGAGAASTVAQSAQSSSSGSAEPIADIKNTADTKYSNTHWVPASQNNNKVCYSGDIGKKTQSECKDALIKLKGNNNQVLFGTWLQANQNCRYGMGDTLALAQASCDNTAWDQCSTDDWCSTITLGEAASASAGAPAAAATPAAPAKVGTAAASGAGAASTVAQSAQSSSSGSAEPIADIKNTADTKYSNTHWVPASQNNNKVCYSGDIGKKTQSECKDALIKLKGNNNQVLFGTWLQANQNCRYGMGDTLALAQASCDNTAWDQCSTDDWCSTITLGLAECQADNTTQLTAKCWDSHNERACNKGQYFWHGAHCKDTAKVGTAEAFTNPLSSTPQGLPTFLSTQYSKLL